MDTDNFSLNRQMYITNTAEVQTVCCTQQNLRTKTIANRLSLREFSTPIHIFPQHEVFTLQTPAPSIDLTICQEFCPNMLKKSCRKVKIQRRMQCLS
jgi:hypothetical protein